MCLLELFAIFVDEFILICILQFDTNSVSEWIMINRAAGCTLHWQLVCKSSLTWLYKRSLTFPCRHRNLCFHEQKLRYSNTCGYHVLRLCSLLLCGGNYLLTMCRCMLVMPVIQRYYSEVLQRGIAAKYCSKILQRSITLCQNCEIFRMYDSCKNV